MLLIWKNALYFSVIKWVWDSSCMWVSDQAGITVCMCDRWLFDRGSVCVLTGTLHRLLLAVGDRQTHIDPTALSVTLSLSLSCMSALFKGHVPPPLSLTCPFCPLHTHLTPPLSLLHPAVSRSPACRSYFLIIRVELERLLIGSRSWIWRVLISTGAATIHRVIRITRLYEILV